MEDNKKEAAERIRTRILSLIEGEFESDAAFERRMGLGDKTVNNWRRGRSASYMRMLPAISELFRVNVGELLDMPLHSDTSELSEDELRLLNAYRRSASVPPRLRAALLESLESVISLYVGSVGEAKNEKRVRKKKDAPIQNGGDSE